MRVGFLGIGAPGHLNPMTTLARTLQSRKHDVVFISLPIAEPFVRAANLAFVPCCEKEFPASSTNERRKRLSSLQGEEALQFTVQSVAILTETMVNSLPATLAAAGVDAVVLDTYQFFVELVPLSLGMPYAHVSNALHFDYTGHTPLCLYDWPHGITPTALARNRKGVANFTEILLQANGVIRAYAERVGLKVDWKDPSATISKLAWLSQTPKEFDFESSHWPPQFHHTGPFHDDAGRMDTDFPWERLTEEPLVFASTGTIQNGLPKAFRAIVAAVALHKGLQLVLSIGDNLDPEEIGPLPKNTIVARRAPQLELLKRASVCITHAGLNTVLEALAQGVPQIAIPVTNDQPGVAARIADKKTGLVAPLKELSAFRLSILIDEVLKNPTYRDNARYLQKKIVEANGLSVAAGIWNDLIDLPRRPASLRTMG